GADIVLVALLELREDNGVAGLGEAAPASRYRESASGALDFFAKVDARKLSFENIPGSMKYLDTLADGQFSAKSAVNAALLDGAARKAGQPLHDFLGLGFREKHHVTSFTIGIAQ